MRSKLCWLGFAAVVLLALALTDGGDAQPPPGKGKKGPGPLRNITAEEIVERILSFDKNSDGKVTKDELPERMQHLIALGDVNKDGALDKEEIRKLADVLESFAGLDGGPGVPPPPPFGGPKGGGPKGPPLTKGAFEVQRTLDDMDINAKARDKADRLVRAHQDKVRRFEELTRAELVLQMKEVLSEEDYRVFKSALDRAPPFGGPKTPDWNRRIEQLQKELDELRGKLAP
jgi:hypothetical protein